MTQSLLSAAAIVLTFALFVPYLRMTARGEIQPHVFSWAIWGMSQLVVFAAQLAGGAGRGAWAIGLSGLLTGLVGWLAWRRRGDTQATRSDWAFLFLALAALPCWFFTSDPLWAVVILTLVDLLGFGPTLRTAWARPREESVGMFAWSSVRNALVVASLSTYSTTTVLFPAAVGVACAAVAVVLIARRRVHSKP